MAAELLIQISHQASNLWNYSLCLVYQQIPYRMHLIFNFNPEIEKYF